MQENSAEGEFQAGMKFLARLFNSAKILKPRLNCGLGWIFLHVIANFILSEFVLEARL